MFIYTTLIYRRMYTQLLSSLRTKGLHTPVEQFNSEYKQILLSFYLLYGHRIWVD